MYTKSLHTYLKNKKGELDSEPIDRRIKYLQKLLDLEENDLKGTLEPVLYILGELVYDYYSDTGDNVPFKDMPDKKRRDLLVYIRNIRLKDEAGISARRNLQKINRKTLFDLFMYFIDSPLWHEYEYYDSDEELYDILEYLNRYHKILYIWFMCGNTYPKHDETIHYCYTKDFSLALYDRNKLPWESDFQDVIVDFVEDELKDYTLYDIDEIKKKRKNKT